MSHNPMTAREELQDAAERLMAHLAELGDSGQANTVRAAIGASKDAAIRFLAAEAHAQYPEAKVNTKAKGDRTLDIYVNFHDPHVILGVEYSVCQPNVWLVKYASANQTVAHQTFTRFGDAYRFALEQLGAIS